MQIHDVASSLLSPLIVTLIYNRNRKKGKMISAAEASHQLRFKEVIITLVLVLGFSGVILPLRFQSSQGLLSYATLFSAGVILSVAMCHLLPEAQETLGAVMEYPMANTLCIVGLFLVLAVERLFNGQHEAVIATLKRASRPAYADYSDDEETPCLAASGTYCKDPIPEIGYGATDNKENCRETNHHHHLKYSSKIFRQGLQSGVSLSQHMSTSSPKPCEHNNICDTECHPNPMSKLSVSFMEKPTGLWVALTVLSVLSFHSVIEGLALGSAQNQKSIFVLAVAILSHKFLAAVSLGISLLKADIARANHIWYAAIFSGMTPFGALMGFLIADYLAMDYVNLFAAVCQALGSGTFLYISLLEFIPEELSGGDIGKKLAVCFTGFTLMALVAIVV